MLLELIIDPTCSIVLERQPAELDIMERAPRDPNEKILTAKNLLKSVLQGIAVFAASFGTYYAVLQQNPLDNAPVARSMGLAVIFLSNIFLVQVNSSNTDFAICSMKRLIKDKVMWAITIGTITGLIIMFYTPLSGLLKLAPLSALQFLLVAVIAAAAVMWYELVKLVKFVKGRGTSN